MTEPTTGRAGRTLVIVPTLDEVSTIAAAVTGARRAGADVLVVDDGSRDGTLDVVDGLCLDDDGVALLARGRKLGLGSAYLDAFAWGLARDYTAFGEMDADLSHDPDAIPDLMAALDDADLVIGSRYVPGGSVVDWPVSRRLLSRGGNRYVRVWTGVPVADVTAGFRLYHRSVLESIDLTSIAADGYAFQIEMALRTWRKGFRIAEVPITFVERQVGESKMSRSIVAEALWRVPLWGARARLPGGAP